MLAGITGHQERPGIDWPWVDATLRIELTRLGPFESCVSSLATGSDQVFARVALELGIKLLTIVPMPSYDGTFTGRDLVEYRRLLSLGGQERLPGFPDNERSFFEAGKRVALLSDVLFAVWDGKKAEGLGGTADIVRFARERGKRVVHLNPIELTVRKL